MAPKAKKPIDEPPAHSTRAKTDGGADGKSESSRKRAADYFDGEIAENAEKVVPRSKVPKAKTAKQTAEVEAESKPIHVDHTHDEMEITRDSGDLVRAEPSAHAKSHAKASKAKATKDESAQAGDAGESTSRGKAKKSKVTAGEDAQASKADDAPKPSKSKKNKSTKGEAIEPPAADEHAIATEKTHPGGDRVEVEPTKPAKSKKGKPATSEGAGETPAANTSTKGGQGRPKKADHKDDAPAAHNDHVETEKTHPGGDRVEVEPTKPVKGKKGKSTKDKAADEPPAEVAKPREKSRGSKTAGNDESSKAKPAATGKRAAKAAEAKPSGKKATGKDKSAKSEEKSQVAEQAASKEVQGKGKRIKSPSEKAKRTADAAEIEPDMAMDDSAFDSLLATTDKGKQPIDEGPASTQKSKPGKASKKASEDQSKTDAPPKATAKPEKKAKDAPEASTSKPRKRKTPTDHDPDAVKTDVLDPLSDLASAKKKQKKSRTGALEAVGSLLGSTVDSAKKKAEVIMDYAGDITRSAQKGVMDDVAGLAEGAVEDEKEKQEGAAAGAKKPENEHPVEDDDASFFGDTEFLKGFESSGDERDGEDVDFDAEKEVPTIDRKKTAKAKAIESTDSSSPGYIYVGRIPHGFYESQMRAYFSQFGHITNFRLSRNKKTGRSKHFAFLEFQSEEVAKIVAQTMDNYLLFGHILKVKVIPKDQLHPETFKGANRRFTAVPWSKIQARELAMPASREQWEKRVEKEKDKRESKAEKAKELGYEFEAPLKGVDSVPVKKGKAVEDGTVEEEEQTLITHEEEGEKSLVITETTKVKKSKNKKGKDVESSASKTVKQGKRKAEEQLDKAKDATADVSEPAAKKVKKGKEKAVDSVAKGKEGVSPEAATVAKKTAEKAKKGMK